MEFTTISTGSKGNCYVLKDSAGEILILDAGVSFDSILEAINFDIGAVKGVLITHEHGDHIKSANECIARGLNVYLTRGTAGFLKDEKSLRVKIVEEKKTYVVGSYLISPFAVDHDVVEPVGFLIQHAESGKILYLTDSKEVNYNFSGVEHLIIEANYCEDILQERFFNGSINNKLGDRVINSHFSIQKLIKVLKKWNLSMTINIILIHLSDTNSDAKKFQRMILGEYPSISVDVADDGFFKKLSKKRF